VEPRLNMYENVTADDIYNEWYGLTPKKGKK
jgi:hypothetical protein